MSSIYRLRNFENCLNNYLMMLKSKRYLFLNCHFSAVWKCVLFRKSRSTKKTFWHLILSIGNDVHQQIQKWHTPIQENFIYKKQGPSPISLVRATRIFSKAKTLKFFLICHWPSEIIPFIRFEMRMDRPDKSEKILGI